MVWSCNVLKSINGARLLSATVVGNNVVSDYTVDLSIHKQLLPATPNCANYLLYTRQLCFQQQLPATKLIHVLCVCGWVGGGGREVVAIRVSTSVVHCIYECGSSTPRPNLHVKVDKGTLPWILSKCILALSKALRLNE